MRTLGVVVDQPLVKVGLEGLHAGIELLPKSGPEEFVEGRLVEAFHKAVGLRAPDLSLPVFDVVEGEVQLAGVRFGPAELPAVIGKDGGHRQALLAVEGQYVVVEHGDGTFRDFAGMEKAEGVAPVGVDHGLHIDCADAFKAAHVEGVSWARSSPGRLLST